MLAELVDHVIGVDHAPERIASARKRLDGAGIDFRQVLARAVDSGLLHPDLVEDLLEMLIRSSLQSQEHDRVVAADAGEIVPDDGKAKRVAVLLPHLREEGHRVSGEPPNGADER